MTNKIRVVKITEKISRLARFYFLPTLNPGDAPARYKYYKQYLRTNITQVIIYEENIKNFITENIITTKNINNY